MRPNNLISVYQGAAAIESLGSMVEKKYKVLKSHEVRTLGLFCNQMITDGLNFLNFDGYFVSYSIAQIGKEFDLLRFSSDSIINIEIKSELKKANKHQKIVEQMRKNYYYLKFLGKKTQIFSYIENDGFYKYDENIDDAISIESSVLANTIKAHSVDYTADPDKLFVPSNYLISPFNLTDSFIKGEYFLTTAQQKIKEEIYEELENEPFMYFCLSANAGTGKTLLLYDIAKEKIQAQSRVMVVHCGKLNQGHQKLIDDYGWNVKSIRSINQFSIESVLENCDLLIIDESQRIREHQLNMLVEKSIENKVPIIFSYDTKQYLRNNESRDISDYLSSNHPEITFSQKRLTTKIRTNKEMASFINNLFKQGSSQDHLNYSCITIDYIENEEDLSNYIAFLGDHGWTPITFTTSQYDPDPYSTISNICDRTAHDVIGQEFSKVVLVMDSNFKYSDSGKLMVRHSYYSADGMLYQIVTRVVDELKISSITWGIC